MLHLKAREKNAIDTTFDHIPGLCLMTVRLTQLLTARRPIYQTRKDSLDPSLTLASLEAAVVAHRAEELKNKDGHSHHGQAHDEHHHPDRWTVGLFAGKERKI